MRSAMFVALASTSSAVQTVVEADGAIHVHEHHRIDQLKMKMFEKFMKEHKSLGFVELLRAQTDQGNGTHHNQGSNPGCPVCGSDGGQLNSCQEIGFEEFTCQDLQFYLNSEMFLHEHADCASFKELYEDEYRVWMPSLIPLAECCGGVAQEQATCDLCENGDGGFKADLSLTIGEDPCYDYPGFTMTCGEAMAHVNECSDDMITCSMAEFFIRGTCCEGEEDRHCSLQECGGTTVYNGSASFEHPMHDPHCTLPDGCCAPARATCDQAEAWLNSEANTDIPCVDAQEYLQDICCVKAQDPPVLIEKPKPNYGMRLFGKKQLHKLK